MMRWLSRATVTAAVVALATSLTACASSQPTRPSIGLSTVATAPKPPPTAHAGTQGQIHLTDYATNDSATSNVILAGAVGDFGTATRSDADGHLKLALSRGRLTLDISSVERKFKASLAALVVNQQTCSAVAAATGSASVVNGSGTGQFVNVGGRFNLTITLDEVYHPGACRDSDAYLSQVLIMTGWGSLTTG